MAAELIATDGPLKGVVLSLSEGEQWLLGRDPQSCQLVVEDSTLAREAVTITLTENGYAFQASEGVTPKLNGKDVSQGPLNDGDVITIGQNSFTFYLVEEFEELSFGSEPSDGVSESIDFTGDKPVQKFADDEQELEFEGVDPDKEEDEDEELSAESIDQPTDEKETPSEELSAEGVDQPSEEKLPPSEELSAEGVDQPSNEETTPSEGLESEGVEEIPPPSEPEPQEDAIEENESQEPTEEFVHDGVEKDLGESEEERQDLAAEGHDVPPPVAPSEEFEQESYKEENDEEEPLFHPAEEDAAAVVDLTPSVRFLLKVIAGPNTGAEFALEMGKSYTMGTEPNSCDIVFHDLSVSREHAKLYLSENGDLEIEDLGSRNGVLVDQEQIQGRVPLRPSLVVTLGTSAFFVIDKDAPQETIVAPAFQAPKEEPEEEKEELPAVEEEVEEEVVALKEEHEPKPAKSGISIYVSIVCSLALLLAISMISLLQTKDLKPPPKDYVSEIRLALQDFPSVKYTYSPNNSRLFLVGHVATGIEKDELFYNLNTLSFIKGVDDHVVNDEAVWQEMNILLSKQSSFRGVSMHSPRPAVFVLNGYLRTEKQAADLTDWINTHFNYLSLLENRVVVEEGVIDEVSTQLIHNQFGAVAVTFSAGELTLAGYVGSAQAYEFERLVHSLGQLPGVRNVQNFVVIVAPEQQVIDLNQRYPGRFKVTGYSKHGDVNINVVINGQILMRGDSLEGMTLTSIQPHAVFFEKDGLKYKLEYNK
ncbi:MAG: hypothetical protein S4CHLAM81_14840 [Chlamydiales bacterium]|nr:hypothetical protein [Chlamydiales bacterium]MCH9636253.1 hypothetical protein [Chlamydiales bacterium]MCH9703305.1 type III secretion system inner membrane ring subunit SctD [Chlamydiota bacterium]